MGNDILTVHKFICDPESAEISVKAAARDFTVTMGPEITITPWQ